VRTTILLGAAVVGYFLIYLVALTRRR